jgi:hypothetical protein
VVAAVLMGKVRASGSIARHAGRAALWVLASVVSASPARAELDLKWNAPPACPGRAEVLERIERLAGSTIDQTGGLSLDGAIEQVGGKYRLTLLVRSGSDVRKRVIESEKCADLAGAAAITVALLLGVDMSTIEQGTDVAQAGTSGAGGSGAGTSGAGGSKDNATAGQKEDAQTSEQNRATQAKPAPPRKPEPSRESSSRAAVVLRVPMAAADLGPLPRPALGVGLGTGMRVDSWRFIVAGRVSLKQSIDAPDSNGAFGADLTRMMGELAVCYGFRVDAFEVAPCAGVALEYLKAQGFGDEVSPSSQRAIWPAPSAGGVAHWYALDSLALFVGVNGYVEVSRPRIVVEGLGEVAQLAPAAVGVTFGVEWIL